MPEKRTYGLKEILMGDVGAALASPADVLGKTYKGTASIVQEDGESKDFYCEELDDAIERISKKGPVTIEWAIVDFTAGTMVKVLGGTDNAGTWEAPDTAPELEKQLQITTKKNHVIKVARARIEGKLDIALGDEELGLIRIRATVLAPAAGKSLTHTPPA